MEKHNGKAGAMENMPVVFMVAVAVLVLLLFCVGICIAASNALWQKPGEMPGLVSYFVSAVNVVLAANLGALLGIRFSLRGWQVPPDVTEKLQWAAAGWYVLMLLLAAVAWGFAVFPEQGTKGGAEVLAELTKSAIGILVAILAAVLGVQTAVTRARRLREMDQGAPK